MLKPEKRPVASVGLSTVVRRSDILLVTPGSPTAQPEPASQAAGSISEASRAASAAAHVPAKGASELSVGKEAS